MSKGSIQLVHGQGGALRVRGVPFSILPEAWVQFIGRFEPYVWYGTHTFREEVHPEAADKCWRLWMREVNEAAHGRRYREKGTGATWVRALERQRRGVVHFHSLVGGIPPTLRRLFFMDRWDELAGYARIVPYDVELGARGYLSKYVLKGGEIDVYVPPDRLDALAASVIQLPFQG